MNKETPFFCNLNAFTADEHHRHAHLTQQLAQALLETTELSNGYAFEIDGSRMSVTDLAAWSDLERRCCQFLDVALELGRETGPVTVRLTGREGVKPFIRAEFPKMFPL